MKKQKKTEKWLKGKGYIHLLGNQSSNKVRAVLNDEKLVTRHCFIPLIFKTIKERKYKKKKSSNGEIVRSHTKINKQGKIESTAKIRPIHYASHLDSCIYARYSEKLKERYKKVLSDGLSDCITAYRKIKKEDGKGKNNIDFAKDVFDEIKRRKDCVAIGIDIKSFFSSLNHKKLKKAWSKLLDKKSLPPDHYNLFKSITNFTYINLKDLKNERGNFNEKKLAENRKKGIRAFYLNKAELDADIKKGKIRICKNNFKDDDKIQCGIPQGLPISATLANLYLLEFDKIIYKLAQENNGFYRRYSDDIVIVCDLENESTFTKEIKETLEKYKLRISSAKTEKCFFKSDENKICLAYKSFQGEKENKEDTQHKFSYLGFDFNGHKTLIKQKSISKFYRKMKSSVKTKAKHLEKLTQKTGIENHPLRLKKIYKSFSGRGKEMKTIHTHRNLLKYNTTLKEYRFEKMKKLRDKKHWGNFIGYAYKASRIMNEPSIRKQLRNHVKILNKTIDKRLNG